MLNTRTGGRGWGAREGSLPGMSEAGQATLAACERSQLPWEPALSFPLKRERLQLKHATAFAEGPLSHGLLKK